MDEKIIFNKEIKMIKRCKNFKELFNEIKKAFNIDDIYNNKIEIKTEDKTDIKNQDDFELISESYPPLIVNIPIYSNNQNTKNNNNQNNNPNSNNFEQNNFLTFFY